MKNSAILLALCVAAPLSATLADAATLKPFSTLSGPIVRLSDIWDGVKVDKPLGPAPAPGGRITVPSAQLAAIARDFGVSWQPGSGGERAVLERPGRELTRDDVKPALWAALTGAGASSDSELEIAAFTAALVPAEAKLDVTVHQLDVDQATGRFSAALDISADDETSTQLRITGRVRQMIDVPVLRRRVLPGDIIAAGDLDWAHIYVGLARGDIVHAPIEAIGLAAKHGLPPNQPILAADLGRPVIVQKGDNMTLTLDQPGIALTARGVATEPGGMGDHIHVLNNYTHMAVEAEITGPGKARIIPGTARPFNRFVAAR